MTVGKNLIIPIGNYSLEKRVLWFLSVFNFLEFLEGVPLICREANCQQKI